MERCDSLVLSTRKLVHGISERVQKSQANLEAVQGLLGVFSKSACVTRRSSHRGDLLYVADMGEKFIQQYKLISDTGERVHTLVQVRNLFCPVHPFVLFWRDRQNPFCPRFYLTQENAVLLGADVDSESWKAYTQHVDRMVLGGFCSAARHSLQYLVDNTDSALCIAPLFEVQLTLTSEMTFHPPLDLSKTDNFYHIIDKMVADIFKMALYMSRVAKNKQAETYQVCVMLQVDM